MALGELIFSVDTLNQGRYKLNNWFSGTSAIWSSSTGTYSVIKSNAYGNLGNSALGYSSMSFGMHNIASSKHSTVLWGSGNTASGQFSLAGGQNNLATNNGSITIGGKQNKASGAYSSVIGGQINSATTIYSSVIGGRFNIASGQYSSVIGGTRNKASGAYSSVIGGADNIASGQYSAVIGGNSNSAAHDYSVAMGGGSMTRGICQLVIGSHPGAGPNVAYNTILLSGSSGTVIAEGGFITGTADIAEYFEWSDKNVNNENRLGYFVSFIDGKIEIGNSDIVGIVSSAPGFIGDSPELSWNNMYLKDDWNRKITETYKSYSWFDENKRITVFEDATGRKMIQFPNPSYLTGLDFNGIIPDNATIGSFTSPKINPDYDSSSSGEYVPRSERKEWAPIGLIGKIHVRTAEPIIKKSIDVNAKGLAINGTKYRIINTIRPHTDSQYGIVRVFFK